MGDQTRKINIGQSEPKISNLQFEFMKRIERQNLERASIAAAQRRSTNRFAIGLTTLVVGIYVYTLSAVKQETFLDDFLEPEKIADEE